MLRRQARRRAVRRVLVRLGIGAGVVAVLALAAVVLVPLATADREVCLGDPASFPSAGVRGWQGEQLANAAVIISTARELGFDRDGQILGVMTAMGESSLRNIDYGDWETSGVRNPDGTRTSSIGLFQQQSWWGSVEQRMDPAGSAELFYARLARLDGWERMAPSHAIHRVQINTDREHYARFESDAAAVVDTIGHVCAESAA